MSVSSIQEVQPLSLFLKENTTSRHESLDKRIMSLEPFADVARYAQFVRTQARLQWVTAAWYQNDALQGGIPDLSERLRLQAALQDCQDLGISSADMKIDEDAAAAVSIANQYEALGWLYTVEGSNLGAAFLLKHAQKTLGLSETHGARHLAGHEDGRGLHWRRFKDAFDAIALTDEQRQQALVGAQAAFAFARAGVDELLAPLVAAH